MRGLRRGQTVFENSFFFHLYIRGGLGSASKRIGTDWGWRMVKTAPRKRTTRGKSDRTAISSAIAGNNDPASCACPFSMVWLRGLQKHHSLHLLHIATGGQTVWGPRRQNKRGLGVKRNFAFIRLWVSDGVHKVMGGMGWGGGVSPFNSLRPSFICFTSQRQHSTRSIGST